MYQKYPSFRTLNTDLYIDPSRKGALQVERLAYQTRSGCSPFDVLFT